MPAYDYDIIASFPSAARNLVDIRYCDWAKSSEYQPRAVYGYCRCEVTIYDWVVVSPILHREEDGSLVSFTGACEEFLTKGEIDFVNKWGIGEVKILEGYWTIPK